MKRFIVVLLLLVLVIGASVPASAATQYLSQSINITFNGSTAVCKLSVIDYGKDIDVTLELWRGSTLVTSWSDSGVSQVRIEENYGCISGVSYYLKAYGTAGNTPIELRTLTKICP